MVLRSRSRQLRNKVTIQQATETISSVGEPVESWTTYAIRSAKIAYSGSREAYRIQQYISEMDAAFKLRYDGKTAAITTKMRVSYDSRIFLIKGVINLDEMNRDIIVACVEDT